MLTVCPGAMAALQQTGSLSILRQSTSLYPAAVTYAALSMFLLAMCSL